MKKNYNIDDIEQFLNKELSATDLAAFEEEVATDKELSEEVAFHEDIITGIQTAGVMDFKKMVTGVHADMKEEGFFLEEKQEKQETTVVKKEATVRSISLVRRLAIAASFAVLLAAGFWVFSNQSATPEQLFADNFTIPQEVLTLEVEDRISETGFGTNKDALAVLKAAMTAYNAKNYTAALPQFTAFQAQAPQDALVLYAKFYEGVSLLKLNQLDKAAVAFEKAVGQDRFPLQNEAKWYLALTYLKQNQVDLATPLLQELSQTKDFSLKATKVLKKL